MHLRNLRIAINAGKGLRNQRRNVIISSETANLI
jgi:hypothetical protein